MRYHFSLLMLFLGNSQHVCLVCNSKAPSVQCVRSFYLFFFFFSKHGSLPHREAKMLEERQREKKRLRKWQLVKAKLNFER